MVSSTWAKMAFRKDHCWIVCLAILSCSLFVIGKRHSKHHYYYQKHRHLEHSRGNYSSKRSEISPTTYRNVYTFSVDDEGIRLRKKHGHSNSHPNQSKRQNIEVAEVLKDLAELATAVSEGPTPIQVQNGAGQPTPQPISAGAVTAINTAPISVPVNPTTAMTVIATDGTDGLMTTPLTIGSTVPTIPVTNATQAPTTKPPNVTTAAPTTTASPNTTPTTVPTTATTMTVPTKESQPNLLEWLKKILGQAGGTTGVIVGGGGGITGIPGIIGGGLPGGGGGLPGGGGVITGGGGIPGIGGGTGIPGVGGIPGITEILGKIPGIGGIPGIGKIPGIGGTNGLGKIPGIGGIGGGITGIPGIGGIPGISGGNIGIPGIGGPVVAGASAVTSAISEIKISVEPDGKITINHPMLPNGQHVVIPGLVNGKMPGLDPKGEYITYISRQKRTVSGHYV